MASSALLKSCASVRSCATSTCNFAFGWTVRLRGIGFTIKNFQFDARARTQKSRTCLTLSFCLVRIEVAVSSFKAVTAAALRSHLPKWRNWQTRMVQVHVPARVWGFESLLRHHLIRITGLSVPVTNTATFRIFSVLASTGKKSNANPVSQDIHQTHSTRKYERLRTRNPQSLQSGDVYCLHVWQPRFIKKRFAV